MRRTPMIGRTRTEDSSGHHSLLQYIAAINANKAKREAREVGEREGMFPMSFVMQAMNDDDDCLL